MRILARLLIGIVSTCPAWIALEARALPERCDTLPDTFAPSPRQPMGSRHAYAIAVLSMPEQQRGPGAVDALPHIRAVRDREVQWSGRSSPQAAIAMHDHAQIVKSATPTARQALRQAEAESREALDILWRTAGAPAHVDFLVSTLLPTIITTEDKADPSQQKLLADLLARHRRAFGDIVRQWPIWEQAIRADPKSPAADRLRRDRVEAADRMNNGRAAFEARAELMNFLSESGDRSPELLQLARAVTAELTERAQRDIAHGKFDRPCSWVSPIATRTHLKTLVALGSEQERTTQLGVAVRHQGFAADFSTFVMGAVINATPIVEARYADWEAYRDALAIAGTQEGFKGAGKGTAYASYAARLLASAYADLSSHSTAVLMYRDALSLLQGKEDEDRDYTLALLRDLADAEWRFGGSAAAEDVVRQARELRHAHQDTMSVPTTVGLLRIEAEMADARLDDARAAELFGRIVDTALARSRLGPDSAIDADGDAAHSAAGRLVELHLRGRFCTGCGAPIAAPAQRWLGRFANRARAGGGDQTGSTLGASEFLLLRRLPQSAMPDAAWRVAIADLSASDRAQLNWKRWRELVSRRLGPKAEARAVAQVIALYLASGADAAHASKPDEGMARFVSFLQEPDIGRKRTLWKAHFDEIAQGAYEQHGGDMHLYEDLDSLARLTIDTGFAKAGRVVLEYLVEKIESAAGNPDGVANMERVRIDIAPLLASVRAQLAEFAVQTGELALASRHLDEATRLAKLRLAREWRTGNERAAAALRDLRSSLGLIAQLRTRIATAARPRDPAGQAASRAFEDLQLAMLSESAMASLAAQRRRIIADGDLATAVKARDAHGLTIDTMDMFRQVAGWLLPDQTEKVRAVAVTGQRQAEATIKARLPASEDLAAVTPASADSIRRLLQADEALLIMHASSNGVYGSILVPGSPVQSWISPVPLADLERRITRLRDGADVRAGALPRFPVDVAAELFELLLGPIRPVLERHSKLIVMVDGALQSLPFAVLLRQHAPAPLAQDEFRSTRFQWLGRSHALSQLLSVRQLEARGQDRLASQAKFRFVGIGNPTLTGPPATSRAVADYAGLFKAAAIADVDAIRRLPALPETETELREIGARIGAGPDDLLLGPTATETAVKNKDLRNYQILAFATHGLVGGRAGVNSEPGLVLTPPARGDAHDDGLLTASEVASLTLDADLVILSACNTAASDGKLRAEGFSGLARGFITAGARSLLVTHWSIPSAPAVEITTRMVALWQEKPELGRARTLQQAIIHMIDHYGPGAMAHPANWGAFILVGTVER